MAAGVIPGAGDLYDLLSAAIGYDAIADERLSGSDRLITVVGTLAGSGRAARELANAAEEGAGAARRSSRARGAGRLTNGQARDLATHVGYGRQVRDVPINTRGQPAFTYGKNYITPDVDSHNGGCGRCTIELGSGSERTMRSWRSASAIEGCMAFSISFTAELLPEAMSRVGVLVLGDYSESFLASLEYWTEAQYEEHWRAAIERVVAGEDRSCLITSIRPPEVCAGVAWWPLYRVGEIVYVQNAILYFDTLMEPFDLSKPYLSVPDRETISLDGEMLSEWEVMVEDLNVFLRAQTMNQ